MLGKSVSFDGHAHSDYAAASHTHDDRYYTETEVNNFLNNKANSNHTHSGYATTSTVNTLATKVSSLESKSSTIYENTSVKNYTRKIYNLTYDNNGSSYPTSKTTTFNITAGFNISRVIFKTAEGFAAVLQSSRYREIYENSITYGPQHKIGKVYNTDGGNRYSFNLYMRFSGSVLYFDIENASGSRGDTCIDGNVGDIGPWNFIFDIIQDL